MTAASSSPSATSTRSAGGVESLSASRLLEQPGAWSRARAARAAASRTSSGAFEQLERDVLAGRGLDLQIAPPGQEPIDPGDDLILVPADASTTKRAVQRSVPGASRIIGVSRHSSRRLTAEIAEIAEEPRSGLLCVSPRALRFDHVAIAQHGRDDVVAVGEDGRGDRRPIRRACA